MDIPKFKSKKELFDFLVKNQKVLIAEKKFQTKFGDVLVLPALAYEEKDEETTKAISTPAAFTGEKIKVVSAINTTMVMDSHDDVHINGLWNKSVKENKSFYLLKEHKLTFENIISDQVKASVKMMTWKELGYDANGETQVLLFDSMIDKARNPYMFEQYINGWVKNHSVGMQYVSIGLAVNNKDYVAEKALFDKYIDKIVNKDYAEEKGYFWAVTEAKAIEGSAVPIGSNKITPTLLVEEKTEPLDSTHTEPPAGTQKEQKIDYKKLTNNFNLI